MQPVSQKESRLRFFWCGRYGSATFNTAGLHRDSDLASRYFIISLTKNHSAGQITQAARCGDGQDDHHGSTDSVIEGDSEKHHQADLDKSSGPDAKSPGEEACQQPDGTTAQIKYSAGCRAFIPVDIIGNQIPAEKLQIQQRSGQQQHGGRGRRQQLRADLEGNTGVPSRAPKIPAVPTAAPKRTSTSPSR